MPSMMGSLGVVNSSNKQKLQFKFQLPSPLLPSSSMYIKMLSFYPQLRLFFSFPVSSAPVPQISPPPQSMPVYHERARTEVANGGGDDSRFVLSQ